MAFFLLDARESEISCGGRPQSQISLDVAIDSCDISLVHLARWLYAAGCHVKLAPRELRLGVVEKTD